MVLMNSPGGARYLPFVCLLIAAEHVEGLNVERGAQQSVASTGISVPGAEATGMEEHQVLTCGVRVIASSHNKQNERSTVCPCTTVGGFS